MPIDPNWLQTWLREGAIFRLPSGELLLANPLPDSGPRARFYAPDFFLDTPEPWTEFSSARVIGVSELREQLNDFNSAPLTWTAADPAGFERDFAELRAEFDAERLAKAVPIIFETAKARPTPRHRARWIANALEFVSSRPITLHGLWDENEGILGATPETLFSLPSPTTLKTMALAGTRRNGEQKISLLEDPKERKEHQLVIDWIGERLAPLGELVIGETHVQDLGPLSHLKNLIELHANKPLDFSRLIQILHPTPALGGSPQETARAWLKRCDDRAPVRRRRFGAPFGVQWGEHTHAAVAIRNLQWHDDQVLLGAGCGVIAESDAAKEWAELQGKLASVKKIFGEIV